MPYSYEYKAYSYLAACWGKYKLYLCLSERNKWKWFQQ